MIDDDAIREEHKRVVSHFKFDIILANKSGSTCFRPPRFRFFVIFNRFKLLQN